MEATKKRTILSGRDYDRYFAPSDHKMTLVDKWATTDNTVALCLAVIAKSAPAMTALAETFRRPTLVQTCRAIWDFVYTHIAYERDDEGHEQIRFPNRSWADRKRGVDCDDYSVFIGSCLTALGIPFQLRVTAYKGGWQHIYPVVPVSGRLSDFLDQADRDKYIVVDDVTDQFNYEVPYTKKFDTSMLVTTALAGMPLEALSGLPVSDEVHSSYAIDHYVDEQGNTYAPVSGLAGYDPHEEYYVDGLGNIFQKIGGAISQAAKFVGGKVASAAKDVGQGVAKAATWVGNAAKTVVTTPIRLGILAYMKLNVGGKAAKLRFGYIPYGPIVAQAGFGPEAHKTIMSSLGALRAKFTGMGGDANTLRMAILTGNGNKNREVPSTSDDLQGLGALLATDPDWTALEHITDMYSPIPPLAGLQGLSGADGALGIAPAVVIAAAQAVIETLLKVLGNAQANDANDPIPAEYLPPAEPDQSDEDYVSAAADDTADQPVDDGISGFLGATILKKNGIKPTAVGKAKLAQAKKTPARMTPANVANTRTAKSGVKPLVRPVSTAKTATKPASAATHMVVKKNATGKLAIKPIPTKSAKPSPMTGRVLIAPGAKPAVPVLHKKTGKATVLKPIVVAKPGTKMPVAKPVDKLAIRQPAPAPKGTSYQNLKLPQTSTPTAPTGGNGSGKPQKVRTPADLRKIADAVEQSGRMVAAASTAGRNVITDVRAVNRNLPVATATTAADQEAYITPDVLLPEDGTSSGKTTDLMRQGAAADPSAGGSDNTLLYLGGALVAGLFLTSGSTFKSTKRKRPALAGLPEKSKRRGKKTTKGAKKANYEVVGWV